MEPDLTKLYNHGLAICGLGRAPTIAPSTVSAPSGLVQWFSQFPRWPFATFDKVYALGRLQPEHSPDYVPDAVKYCFLCSLCISPLLSADLSR